MLLFYLDAYFTVLFINESIKSLFFYRTGKVEFRTKVGITSLLSVLGMISLRLSEFIFS